MASSAVSVLGRPSYAIDYPSATDVTVAANLAVVNVAAYTDTTGAVQDLRVGASSNLVAEAVNDIQLRHGGSVTYAIDVDQGSNVTPYMSMGLSNSRVVVRDLLSTGMTFATSDTFIGRARFLESSSNVQLSMPQLTSGLEIDPTVTMKRSLSVSGAAGVGGRLVAFSGLHAAREVTVFKDSTLNGATQVGYSWSISDTDQLELIKYSFFAGETAVSKRVAVFGNAGILSTDSSDATYSANLITTSGTSSDGSGGGSLLSGPSVYTVTAAGVVAFTSNPVAINTDAVDAGVSLQVAGTTKSTTVTATEIITSPAFLTTSDERLKNVLGALDGADALAGIVGLSPVLYAWKSDEDQVTRAGFRAQDVGEQLPLAVKQAAAGGLDAAMHVDNTAVLAYLVAAVKELAATRAP